jgi:hypothetical protein
MGVEMGTNADKADVHRALANSRFAGKPIA